MDSAFIYFKTIFYDARTFWSNPRPSTRPSSPTWGTWVTATVSPPRTQVTQILSFLSAVLRIRDILVRIRIRLLSSVTLPMPKKIYFFLQLTRRLSLKNVILCSIFFCCENLFCKHYFSPLNIFMRKGKDPDPYLWLMDPDSGGPKTCVSSGSGSPTAYLLAWQYISSR